MKNNFTICDDILHSKDNTKLLPGDECSPYVIARLISSYSPQYCSILNDTYNTYHSVLDRQGMVDFLRVIFPKSRPKRLVWLGRGKQSSAHNSTVNLLADSLEMSRKEIQQIVDIFPQILDENTEEEKIYKKLD
jgi:hypothetical protein